MSTIKFIRHTVALGLALMLSGPVFALEGALLGLTTGAPVITTNPVGTCTYDDAGDVLTIETQPFFITFDGIGGSNVNNVFNTAGTAPGGIATYILNIDAAGNLSGGSVTVSGLTQDTVSTIIYGPTLLTGVITDFGIRDDGVNDVMDIQATFTGGDLGTLFPPSADIASTFLLNISTYPGTFASSWNCAGATATIGSFVAGGALDPFDCYAVNKVSIKDKSGTNKDEIKVTKAGFRLDAPNTVDLDVDTVTITVGANTYTFPPGSFECKGANNDDCKFKSASGAVPKIEARLNFKKATWELKVKGDDTSGFTAGPIDVTLTVNGFEGTENITLSAKGSKGDKLEYKASPKTSCRLPGSDSSDSGTPGPGKLSCISEMTVLYNNNVDPIELITKTRAAGELLHPNTVYSDTVNNDLGIFHTSCSKCITCGDTDGNFTIVDIDVLPGDKLSQKCGVPDASCTLP